MFRMVSFGFKNLQKTCVVKGEEIKEKAYPKHQKKFSKTTVSATESDDFLSGHCALGLNFMPDI